ncbi:MAG TPA: DUF4388 domain-containing protein [Thermodesulfobacteriota bacterium]|nr:DUF4388 domain-containing protein [Thermodesulfobacteriota bacterium]
MALTGNLHVPDLLGVIQLVCLERRTAHLRVRDGTRSASVYFEAGQAVHAQYETLEGEPAFQRILAIEGGVFELEDGVPPPRRTIVRPTQALLLESLHCQDETAQPGPGAVAALARALVEPGLARGFVLADPDGTVGGHYELPDPAAQGRLLAHLVREAQAAGAPLRLGALRRARLYGPGGRLVLAVPYSGTQWLGLEAERGPGERRLEAALDRILSGRAPGAAEV